LCFLTLLKIFGNGLLSPSIGKLASKMMRGRFSAPEIANCLNKITGTHATCFAIATVIRGRIARGRSARDHRYECLPKQKSRADSSARWFQR